MRTRNAQQAPTQPPITGTGDTSAGARRNVHGEPAEATGHISVVGAGITVTGNIEASSDLYIEGQVIGDVRCATLVLAESGRINGRVLAARASVSGTVEGGLETRDLAVEASGRLAGEATYQRLRIANGGTIEGKIAHRVIK